MDPNKVSEKSAELKDRSRINNHLIDHLKENGNDTWDNFKQKVQEVLRDKLNNQDDIEFD